MAKLKITKKSAKNVSVNNDRKKLVSRGLICRVYIYILVGQVCDILKICYRLQCQGKCL